ncbi:MAG: helix-turn-helix transcriptional regulator [Betaproteobacteria bacterium]|nr:helix-turn-helix transcriptional regulator [Betaproteobacteria bacterium]
MNGSADVLEQTGYPGMVGKLSNFSIKSSQGHDAPRWYLWDGGFLALGRSAGVVPPHAHHAIQIVIAIDGMASIRSSRGDWRPGAGIIVRPDVVHSFDAQGSLAAMLMLDPESTEGTWLRTALVKEITLLPDTALSSCLAELRKFCEQPFASMEVRGLIRHCVLSLCAGEPPTRQRDPRVTTVLNAIRDSTNLRVSAETAAAMIHLSPSRFAHLFKQQVGLPFRRYMLWRKLTRATLAIARERTITAAAQAADFADAAHVTRTFQQMFGIPPSAMMQGEFFEISSPFELAR